MEGLIMPCMILKRKPHVLFSVFLLGRQGQDPFLLPFLPLDMAAVTVVPQST